jgi:hypothetical protein
MPVVEDSSTPAVLHQAEGTSGIATTASFSPPAGSWVYVMVDIMYGSNTKATSLTCTDVIGGVVTDTYTAGPSAGGTGNVFTQIFSFYYSAAPGSMAVRVTNSNTTAAAMYVAARVVDGANPSQTGAATFSGTAAFNGSITTTQVGSWVYAIVGSPINLTMTAESNTTTADSWEDTTSGDTTYFGYQTSLTTSPGATTLGWSTAGSGPLVMTEVLPFSAIPATVTLSGIGTITGSVVAALSGTGSISAVWTFHYFPETATLTGSGSITPVESAALLSGSGSINVRVEPSPFLSGSGTITPVASVGGTFVAYILNAAGTAWQTQTLNQISGSSWAATIKAQRLQSGVWV